MSPAGYTTSAPPPPPPPNVYGSIRLYLSITFLCGGHSYEGQRKYTIHQHSSASQCYSDICWYRYYRWRRTRTFQHVSRPTGGKDGKMPITSIILTNSTGLTITSGGTGTLDGQGNKWWGIPGVGYLARGKNRPPIMHVSIMHANPSSINYQPISHTIRTKGKEMASNCFDQY